MTWGHTLGAYARQWSGIEKRGERHRLLGPDQARIDCRGPRPLRRELCARNRKAAQKGLDITH